MTDGTWVKLAKPEHWCKPPEVQPSGSRIEPGSVWRCSCGLAHTVDSNTAFGLAVWRRAPGYDDTEGESDDETHDPEGGERDPDPTHGDVMSEIIARTGDAMSRRVMRDMAYGAAEAHESQGDR